MGALSDVRFTPEAWKVEQHTLSVGMNDYQDFVDSTHSFDGGEKCGELVF